MKLEINELPDPTDFNLVDCVYGGDECFFIYPHLEGKWTNDNIKFRSSIWRKKDRKLVSAGFKKFFNWEQEPHIYPPPTRFNNNVTFVEKLDGSCLIVSKFKGELIIRTRRANARDMLNGHEIDMFIASYPAAFDNVWLKEEKTSLIFEWLTPSNRIVLPYEKPDIKLIGAVNHFDYAYFSQRQLDDMAKQFGVARPKYFHFASPLEMLEKIKALKDEEGVCVYYGNDQHIRKAKSLWYLTMHAFRSNLSLKNMVELFFEWAPSSFIEFCQKVENQFDYECMVMAKPLISRIMDGMKEVDAIIIGMEKFIENIKNSPGKYPKRKDQAEHILSAYGNTQRSGMLFALLDGKDLSDEMIKKLLFQCLIHEKS